MLFQSCASSSLPADVAARDLLVPDAEIYFSVPVEPNKSFLMKASSLALSGTKPGDVRKMLERIDAVYISCSGIDGASPTIGAVASGSFPATLAGFFLKEGNGWRRREVGAHKCYDHMDTGYGLSFASSSLACLASDGDALSAELSRFDSALSGSLLERVDFAESDGAISFFIPDGGWFMETFLSNGFIKIGGVESVAGFLSQVEGAEAFDVSLSLKVPDERMRRAVSGMMRIFGLRAEVLGEDISVSGVRLGWDALLSRICR